VSQTDTFEKIINYGDLCLMPGLVDSHVHINEPGRVDWEGFDTATRAAIAGGVTTIADMPLNSIPVTTSLKALNEKVSHMEGKIWCDVGLLGGVIPGNGNEYAKMVDSGVLGFKCFMCPSGIDEFPHVTRDQILEAMSYFQKLKNPVAFMFHAEHENECCGGEKNPIKYDTFLNSRPSQMENGAIQIIIDLSRQTGVQSHVVHLSSSEAVSMISQAKQEGVNISVETCPHYLCLKAEDIQDGMTHFKCCPPIRNDLNRDILWKAVMSGVIDTIASDHSPCVPELKKLDTGNFMQAWGGIASLQLSLPLIWTFGKQYSMTILDICSKMSLRTAKLLHIDDIVGSIEIGKQADFVVWDPNAVWTVKKEDLYMKNKLSPFLGKQLNGVVKTTYLRGVAVYQDGIVGKPTGIWRKPTWVHTNQQI